MSEQQLLKAKVNAIEEGLKTITERLIDINKAYEELSPEAKAQLSLDPEALNKLSWTTFKNGKGAWTFSDKAPDLTKALLERGSIQIGSFQYKLSGDQNKFITRYPK